MNDHAKQIISQLTKLASASPASNRQIFDDFVDLSLATLEALPRHYVAQLEGKGFAEDTQETEKLFETLRIRYKQDWMWECLFSAFNTLCDSVTEWQDTIGNAYMDLYISNKYTGQFFTPWPVAKMMATMSFHDVEKDLKSRLVAATKGNPIAEAYLISSMAFQDGQESEALQFFTGKILPAIAGGFKPITVCDPCCGSGVMLLAAASECPRWALDWGLIQFYGMDIDQTCVKMARLNCLLYGLNGSRALSVFELGDQQIEDFQEPLKTVYKKAKSAPVELREDLVEDFNSKRFNRYQQSYLFDFEDAKIPSTDTV